MTMYHKQTYHTTNQGNPVDFIAANSYSSARLPKVIKEANSIERGRTMGISFGVKYPKNLKIVSNPNLFLRDHLCITKRFAPQKSAYK